MDKSSLCISYPARASAAYSGPEGPEGATQSVLAIRKTWQSHQQRLEDFEEETA